MKKDETIIAVDSPVPIKMAAGSSFDKTVVFLVSIETSRVTCGRYNLSVLVPALPVYANSINTRLLDSSSRMRSGTKTQLRNRNEWEFKNLKRP
jgi:hypothetical protein